VLYIVEKLIISGLFGSLFFNKEPWNVKIKNQTNNFKIFKKSVNKWKIPVKFFFLTFLFNWLKFLFNFDVKIFFEKLYTGFWSEDREVFGLTKFKLNKLKKTYRFLVNSKNIFMIETLLKQLMRMLSRKNQKNVLQALKVETQVFLRKTLSGFRYLEKGKLSWKALSRKKKNLIVFGRSRLADMSLLTTSLENEVPNLTGRVNCHSNFFF